MNITIYNEFFHEQIYPSVQAVYPQGIHGCLKSFLETQKDFSITCCTFDQKDHGLTEEVLQNTDVLIFWSHAKQDDFSDEVSRRIQKYVLQGMGFIGLHSAHFSKPMKMLLGTSMTLSWKNDQKENLFCINPCHPIAQNVVFPIELPKEEMYGEYFDIPKPDDVIFLGWFSGGQVFRSGCVWNRGMGKIFYFQPGHEEYPVYYDKNIQQIIINAVNFCYNPGKLSSPLECRSL